MENFSLPNQSHLQSILSKNDFIVFVAMLEDKVVGGLTAYSMEQYYSTKPLAYLFGLAVANHLQRQGIGKQLVAEANNYFKSKGFEELFVQADVIDEYAIDFYRSTKPSNEEQVVHFSYTLNN
jgi:aminoglycoside 3-N-acetyltransferase I